MPAILVSIKKDVWKKMKKHPEIKWTQVARQRLEEYADELEGEMNMEELRRRMGPKWLKSVRSTPREKALEDYKKVKESEARRLRLLTQAQRLKESKA
ncbi:hypothetical protein HYV43_02880 [Candidatus Micrarchaeota archaeon]|nr:hypothetical protein [Candidatus Micrarchaeota archaeon]